MSDVVRIQPGAACAPAVADSSTAKSADSPRFQELLQRLQKLADQHRQTPPVEDADQLQEAIRSADDGFVAAMDLRRQLEDAFRRHNP